MDQKTLMERIFQISSPNFPSYNAAFKFSEKLAEASSELQAAVLRRLEERLASLDSPSQRELVLHWLDKGFDLVTGGYIEAGRTGMLVWAKEDCHTVSGEVCDCRNYRSDGGCDHAEAVAIMSAVAQDAAA